MFLCGVDDYAAHQSEGFEPDHDDLMEMVYDRDGHETDETAATVIESAHVVVSRHVRFSSIACALAKLKDARGALRYQGGEYGEFGTCLDLDAIPAAEDAYEIAVATVDDVLQLMDEGRAAPTLTRIVEATATDHLRQPRRPERTQSPGQLVISEPACAHAPPAMTIAPLRGTTMGTLAAIPASV
jgi:hypothetical protein